MKKNGFQKSKNVMNTARLARITKKVPRTISHVINKQRLSEYRLIFCINSGRAGSNYLAELLNSAVGVYSFHEPNPQMIGDNLNLINQVSVLSKLTKENKLKRSTVGIRKLI